MKTFKTLFSVFIVATVLSTGAYAQQTQDVQVSAIVQSTITFPTVTDVSFGVITASTQAVQPANGSSGLTAANNTNASSGQVVIEGNAGVDIDISYNTGVELSDGTNTAGFTPDILTSGGTTIAQTGTTVSLGGTTGLGQITLDIGGTLAGISTPGTYSTTSGTPITLSVSYN